MVRTRLPFTLGKLYQVNVTRTINNPIVGKKNCITYSKFKQPVKELSKHDRLDSSLTGKLNNPLTKCLQFEV